MPLAQAAVVPEKLISVSSHRQR